MLGTGYVLEAVRRLTHLLVFAALVLGLTGVCPPIGATEAADACADEASEGDDCPGEDSSGCSPTCSCLCGRSVGMMVAPLAPPQADQVVRRETGDVPPQHPSDPPSRGVFHPPRAV